MAIPVVRKANHLVANPKLVYFGTNSLNNTGKITSLPRWES